MQKKKILMLSDHALSTSGVGVQSRHLINGLLQKNEWTIRQFGAAIKHNDYDVVQVTPDFIIKPIDGFGSVDLIRQTLAAEKPDVLLIFTDPRFFVWLWEMEDEIHQICPIAYWHVWDNKPYPAFNSAYYEATDLINCHSHATYELVKEHFPDKTNFIPHALPTDVFFRMPKEAIRTAKLNALGPERQDHFVAFWMNRNARRKRPGDLLVGWKQFIDSNTNEGINPKATLLLHTDPKDSEGPDLFAMCDGLGISDSVVFSNERLDFNKINILHNISDCCINISYAEGFGLATLESMQTGTPIIALKTGGLTRQVVDHRDGSENGVAIDVELQSMVGSQSVPYIYEDYCSWKSIEKAITKLYLMSPDEKEALSKKVESYVLEEFAYQKTIDLWHDSLNELIENWELKRDRVICEEIK
jgi:glycosyltransferase involved in cell wall biosynthesis